MMARIYDPVAPLSCHRCEAPGGMWVHRHRVVPGEWRPSADPFAQTSPDGFRRAEKVVLADSGGRKLCNNCRKG